LAQNQGQSLSEMLQALSDKSSIFQSLKHLLIKQSN